MFYLFAIMKDDSFLPWYFVSSWENYVNSIQQTKMMPLRVIGHYAWSHTMKGAFKESPI